jgi:hypothetical protein
MPFELRDRVAGPAVERSFFIRGTQGVLEECVLDIRQRQFLMLLLMVQAQHNAT